MTMTTEDTEKAARRAQLEAEFAEIFANPGSVEDSLQGMRDAGDQITKEAEEKEAKQAAIDAEFPYHPGEAAALKGIADFVRAAGADGISVDDIAAHFGVSNDFIVTQLEFREGREHYLPFQRLADGRWIHYESITN